MQQENVAARTSSAILPATRYYRRVPPKHSMNLVHAANGLDTSRYNCANALHSSEMPGHPLDDSENSVRPGRMAQPMDFVDSAIERYVSMGAIGRGTPLCPFLPHPYWPPSP